MKIVTDHAAFELVHVLSGNTEPVCDFRVAEIMIKEQAEDLTAQASLWKRVNIRFNIQPAVIVSRCCTKLHFMFFDAFLLRGGKCPAAQAVIAVNDADFHVFETLRLRIRFIQIIQTFQKRKIQLLHGIRIFHEMDFTGILFDKR